MTEDEMVGRHHHLNRHEFEQAPEVVKEGKPSVLQSMGSQRGGHGRGDEQQQVQISSK